MSANRIYDTRSLGLDPKVVAQFPRRHVLIVDDNRDTVEIEAQLLEALGQDVRRAYDGESALRLAREEPPEIVLLDIDMPGMSGLEVARRMRELPGMQDTHIVAFTGLGRDEYRETTFASSFDDFVTKPAALTRIISIINQVHQRSVHWVPRLHLLQAKPGEQR